MKSIVFASLGIVVIGAAAAIGYQQFNKSSNSNTNSNANTANSNTAQPIKNNLIGTWIDTQPESKIKLVITEDEYAEFNDGKEQGRSKYRLADEQTVEIMVLGKPVQFKATVEGDTLTVIASEGTGKYRRESANTANSNPAQTAPVDNLKTDNVGNTGSPSPQSENSRTESNELKTTEILFDETTFEFDVISEGEIFTHEYKFRNSGTSPLVIKDVMSNCKCVTVDFPKEPIPPGGMSKIVVRFDSKAKGGRRNQKVWITANTNPPQSYLYLTGEVMGR